MYTDSLRKQHEETLSLIREISGYLTKSSLAENSHQVRLLISTLLGKANYHRGVEDATLYPKLLQHESSEMSSLAERYYKGFIDTKDVLGNYSAKWASPNKIKDWQTNLFKF